jgi:hypothetical protein
MGKMSRDKGKVGEREVAALLREYGFEARRGVQYQGGHDSEDVHHNIPGLHIEVKRVEKLNLNDAMAQASEDASGDKPVVVHRQNKTRWKATLYMEDFLAILRDGQAWREMAVKAAKHALDRPLFVVPPPRNSLDDMPDLTKVDWNGKD